jgi:hypothetical protein
VHDGGVHGDEEDDEPRRAGAVPRPTVSSKKRPRPAHYNTRSRGCPWNGCVTTFIVTTQRSCGRMEARTWWRLCFDRPQRHDGLGHAPGDLCDKVAAKLLPLKASVMYARDVRAVSPLPPVVLSTWIVCVFAPPFGLSVALCVVHARLEQLVSRSSSEHLHPSKLLLRVNADRGRELGRGTADFYDATEFVTVSHGTSCARCVTVTRRRSHRSWH